MIFIKRLIYRIRIIISGFKKQPQEDYTPVIYEKDND